MVILLIIDYRILPANVDTFWLQTLRSLITSADRLANSLLWWEHRGDTSRLSD